MKRIAVYMLVFLLTFFLLSNATYSEDDDDDDSPKKRLTITSAQVDQENEVIFIYINGKNFGNDPYVMLDEDELEIVGDPTNTLIQALLPAYLEPGTYLLLVAKRKPKGKLKASKTDTMDVTIGAYTEIDPIFAENPASGIAAEDITNWDAAYVWGNHGAEGYLTSESDPVFTASEADLEESAEIDQDIAAHAAIADAHHTKTVDASELTSGILPNARLSARVTLQGNVFNTANQLVQLDAAANLPTIGGANLVNLNATAISLGTLPPERLPPSVTLLGPTIEEGELGFDPATQTELNVHKGSADHDGRYFIEAELNKPGTINTLTNPVDWTKLKGVPADFADGVDDTGGGGHSVGAADGSPANAVYVNNDGNVGISTTSPDSELEVNGTVAAKAFASTSPLIFEAPAGTERMRISDSTGNVGIGTTEPGAELEVNGAILVKTSSGASSIKIAPLLTQTWNIFARTGNTNFVFTNGSGEDIVELQQDGNVGIGTTSPGAKLDVNGTVNATSFVGDGSGLTGIVASYTETDPVYSASAAAGITASQLTNWNTAYGWGDHAAAGYLSSYTETDPIYSASAASGISLIDIESWNTAYGWGDHSTAGYSTSWTDGAGQVTANLNVGIGTTSPSALLDVDGRIEIGDDASPPVAGMMKYASGTFQGYNGTEWVALSAGASPWTTSGSDVYYNDGNVGIGTTAPRADSKLYSKVGTEGALTVHGQADGMWSIGVRGIATDISDANIGGYFKSKGKFGYGVWGIAENSNSENYGGYFETRSDTGWAGYFLGGRGVMINKDNAPTTLYINRGDTYITNGYSLGAVAFSGNNDDERGVVGAKINAVAKGAWGGTANQPTELRFYTAPDGNTVQQRMVIDENGKVGIGTTDPGTYTFNVEGNIRTLGALHIGTMDKSTAGIPLIYLGETPEVDSGNDVTVVYRRIQDYTVINGGGNEIIAFHDSGNVGIGTTSPERALHVIGRIKAEFTDGSGNFIEIGNGGSNAYVAHNGIGNLDFRVNGTGIPATKMRITPDGNVGIGTTSPSYPLHMGSGAHVTAGGVWTDASSREYKENIRDLTVEEAKTALEELRPTRFNYKADNEDEYLGFIAEDVPGLVATKDRKGLSPMDIVAVLTKVVQEQQKKIEEL